MSLVVVEVTQGPVVEVVIPVPGVLPTMTGVVSFNTRQGFVTSQSGDYQASQISVTPAGNISSTNVQAAIVELDTEKTPITHVGATGAAHGLVTGVVAGFMASADKTKLDGIASGATANQSDAYLLNRANHTGTQDAATITGLTKSSVGLGNVDNTSDMNKPVSTAQAAADAAVQAYSIQRGNHTGTQTASTISDFTTVSNGIADSRIALQKGAANGIAPLGPDSKVSMTYLPDAIVAGNIDGGGSSAIFGGNTNINGGNA